ncbi:MAG: metalloregulator ArsR/SmtB family transcription factor [Micrococcaceae bacterium]
MVKQVEELDAIFSSLADKTRRDILERVAQKEHTVGELVINYDISFPAISKHLKVLEKARLIQRRKQGKQHFVKLSPTALKSADDYLERYRLIWQSRVNKLENLINDTNER